MVTTLARNARDPGSIPGGGTKLYSHCGLVVTTLARNARDPGSIPGGGKF